MSPQFCRLVAKQLDVILQWIVDVSCFGILLNFRAILCLDIKIEKFFESLYNQKQDLFSQLLSNCSNIILKFELV